MTKVQTANVFELGAKYLVHKIASSIKTAITANLNAVNTNAANSNEVYRLSRKCIEDRRVFLTYGVADRHVLRGSLCRTFQDHTDRAHCIPLKVRLI